MEHHSFALEHLEDRALFSVVGPMDTIPAPTAMPQATAIAMAIAHSPFLGVAFNVAGTYSHPLGNPDAGSLYDFKGSGKTKALGSFTLSARLVAPGLIANGHTTGIIIITNAHGTIRMSVTGPTQSSGVLPPSLSFKIVKGSSGTYASSTGKGQITVSASGTTHKFLFGFKPAS